MNRKKIYTILASLAILTLVIMIVTSLLSSDEAKLQLRQVILTNQEVAGLSEIAQEDATNFDLQSLAATMHVVSTSDDRQISEYYQANYGNPPTLEADQSAATTLADTEPGPELDSTYVTAVKGDLEFNLAVMEDLRGSTKDTELATLLDQVISNYNAHLESIKSYEAAN